MGRPIPINFGRAASAANDAEKLDEIGPLPVNAYRNKFGDWQKRPGLTVFATITGSKAVDGLFECLDGTLIAATNGKLYKISSAGVATEITGSGFAAGPVRFCEGGGYVYAAFNDYPAKINVSASTYTKMAAPWPASVTHICYVADYIICDGLRSGGVSGDLNWTPDAGTSWYTANMQQSADSNLTVMERDKEIYCWGPKSLEVNWNQGNGYAGAWAMIPGASSDCGTLSRYAVARVGDSLIWPTISGDSRKIVAMGKDRNPAPISDSIQDILDSALTFGTTTYGWGINLGGSPCYLIRIKTGATTYRTLLYDTQQKDWYEFKYYNGSAQTYFPLASCLYWQAQGKILIGDAQDTGIIYQFSGLTDNTQPITMILESGNLTRGTLRRKRCESVRMICRRGETANPTTAPTFLLQHSDELGTYNTGRSVSLGVSTDQVLMAKKENGLGSYRARRWKLTHSATDCGLLLARLEEDVAVRED